MRITIGEVYIDCSVDEFAQLYPTILNLRNYRTSGRSGKWRTEKGTLNTHQSIIEVVSRQPQRSWRIREIARETGMKPKTIWKHLARMAKERKVSRVGKGQYRFLSLMIEDKVRSAVQQSEATLEGNGVYEDAQLFDKMFEQVKPLLTSNQSCSEGQIKKQFKKLPSSVIESFLSEAIRRGLIKERLGVFALTQIH